MKIFDTILISFSVVFLVIGMHQTSVHGFLNSYWLFMLMLICFGFYNYRKNKLQKAGETPVKVAKPSKKRKK